MLVQGYPTGPMFRQDMNRQNPNWIKAVCINQTESQMGSDEDWPTLFQFPPREGDFVSTPEGRTLKIIRVIHTIEGNEPIVYLDIAKDITSSTPTDGGAQLS